MPKTNARYVDGFVLVVPKNKVTAYRAMAKQGAKIWKKYGALDYKECMGDDLHPDMGPFKILGFPQMVKLKKGETVWFSYITYKSRAHRDQVNAKVMKDPSMNEPKNKNMSMPFDLKRMAYGGFKVIVGA
jgi:uncharacterized protein YbaA (DUF1428 family)